MYEQERSHLTRKKQRDYNSVKKLNKGRYWEQNAAEEDILESESHLLAFR